MKGKRTIVTMLALTLMLALLTGMSLAQGTTPQGSAVPQDIVSTAFTYQGRLKDTGGLVDNTCDFEFGLWDAASGGAQVGTTQAATGVTVSEGLFTVELDFGDDAFTGEAGWLEIAVRCPAGSGTYTSLSPRQPLTPAPYALSLRPGSTIHNTNSVGTTVGLLVASESGDGLEVFSRYDGVRVESAGGDGIYVDEAGEDGVHIHHADEAGVEVIRAGSPTMTGSGGGSSGFEVEGAEDFGLYVGRADLDGVYVDSAGGSAVYVGWAELDGVHVEAVGGNAIYAGGTGIIRSTADTVLYLSPHDMVVRQENLDVVSLTPLDNGGMRARNKATTGETHYLSIPVSTFGQLFGSQLYVKELEVCYKATESAFAENYIQATTVSKNNGSDVGETYYIYDVTSRDNTAYDCYTLTANTPRVPLDNSTWVQFNVWHGDPDGDVFIYTAKLTLTEEQN